MAWHGRDAWCLDFIKVLEGFIFCCLTFQSAVPQKGSEVNLTLGGIDLNNSGRLAFELFY